MEETVTTTIEITGSPEDLDTVTIPRSEYNALVKQALMLDLIGLAEPQERSQVTQLVQDAIIAGCLEC